MRDLEMSLKQLAAAAAFCLIAVLACGRTAHAANELEMDFWLSGPNYDGRVAPCVKALSTIAYEFQQKESMYWNSALTITGYRNIHEVAFRPWQSDNIPRRYCTGSARTSDGRVHRVNFSIIEDGGFASYGEGVDWCLTGLDRDWAYQPACKAAGP
ncbi:MAG: hypothetical protein ACREDL_25505 [Bradyrhizobium sp.]